MLQNIIYRPRYVAGIKASGKANQADMGTILLPKTQELVKRWENINYLPEAVNAWMITEE